MREEGEGVLKVGRERVLERGRDRVGRKEGESGEEGGRDGQLDSQTLSIII